MVDKVKERKVRKKDWQQIERFIKDEFENRKNLQFRKDHEVIWKEVDRQLKMIPLARLNDIGEEVKPGWHSAIELGELGKVSEVVTADVMRITFPQERDWFEAHVEVPPGTNEETGQPQINEDIQGVADNLLRSMMAQQHQDFGFKARFELSVKEAEHHGSFVAEVKWDADLQVMDGSKVKQIAAPIWVPHSMWNSYPDPSPSIIGTNMFYQGSMIIKSYMPKYKLKRQKGDGWMQSQYEKIPDDEHNTDKNRTKDLEILTWYGDLNIERKSGDDIFLPNSKAVLANGVIVFWEPNELPYPSVIYGGYERQDTRDPYYTSPIIKQAPNGKIASILANKYLDAVALITEPPGTYDGMDPEFAANGGPQIFPGAMTASKGSSAFQTFEIGSPREALEGLQMVLRNMQEGTSVNSVRTGVSNSDRQTATEVNKVDQSSEIRTVDFISKLVVHLRTWLHMQHALNVKHMKEYSFYNDDMDSPDFVRVTGKDLKSAEVSKFEVVGAKGILGEQQRMERTSNVTAFASQNPLFAPLLKPRELLIDAYKDAGHKNPEKYVSNGEQEAEDPRLAEMQQIIQQLQGQLQEATDKREVEIAKLQQKQAEAEMKSEDARNKQDSDAELKQRELAQQYELKIIEIRAEQETDRRSFQLELQKMLNEMRSQAESFQSDIEAKRKSAKARKVRFVDDDTAEIENEDGSVTSVRFDGDTMEIQ